MEIDMEKIELINLFKRNLIDSFVNNYNKINEARLIINDYMKTLSFDYEYDYNTFCKEFISTIELVLNDIDEDKISKLDINMYIYESFLLMVTNKIMSVDKNRMTVDLLNDLKSYLVKKESGE